MTTYRLNRDAILSAIDAIDTTGTTPHEPVLALASRLLADPDAFATDDLRATGTVKWSRRVYALQWEMRVQGTFGTDREHDLTVTYWADDDTAGSVSAPTAAGLDLDAHERIAAVCRAYVANHP